MIFKKTMLAGAAAVALVGAAAADTPAGFYLDLSAGGNWVADLDTRPTWDFDGGYIVKGSAGYKLTNGLRFEFQLAYRDNDFVRPITGAGTIPGSVGVFSQMVNVLYDFDVGEGATFSIGGGLGGARIGFEDDNFSASMLDGRDYVFAYQAIAEFEIMTNDNVGVFVGYNFFTADNFKMASTIINPNPNSFSDDYTAHSGYVGLRYHFWTPEAPLPEPPKAPPAPAKTFIVFFGFDRYDLTAEAQAVIAEAAAAFKATGAVSIAVVGHTDTVGSAAYNQPLSERRANSVKADLVANGVPDGVISTSGRGFSEPLVATGPGVKEPQNRRATIDLSGSAT